MTGPRNDDLGNVVDRVHRLLTDTMHLDVPSVDTDLIESDVIDSLALVELLFAIERELGVTVSLEGAEVDTFRTVRDIGEWLQRSTRPERS